MGWLKLAIELIPVIGNIFAILGRKKAQKKAARIEKVAQVVIEGVDAYAKIENKRDIKDVIAKIAVATGVEDKLHDLVLKYTTPKVK